VSQYKRGQPCKYRHLLSYWWWRWRGTHDMMLFCNLMRFYR
jgi:hypothetical protein